MQNRVILNMRPAAQDFIAQRMIVRPLEPGMILYENSQPFTHAIFPHSGIISLLARMEDGRSVEKTSIGREGFLGFTYLMGGKDSVSQTVVQVPGYASWLPIEDLDAAMEEFKCVRTAMLSYSKALIVQLMETVACNTLHTAEQRVARWLLHADDRMTEKRFALTQESLSRVLGLRRATVSEAYTALSKSGAISYSRGMIEILDRSVLRSHACECYDRIAIAGMGDALSPFHPIG